MTDKTSQASEDAYRVLARKYRPTTFDEMIGQEALVRTLTNAIDQGRLHHAFILTGVRGIGKTTTARIIARAFNCIGEDGKGGPTASPCGVCEHCRAIAEDRHVDVIEMDAASRTGVDDIRELIEGVRYRPTSARYKVYIIDEVHMLSKNAFNALLKTLEEPPEHVKFIFATTETRKVPVTVLSRCQRFDLRRVDTDVLAKHFTGIAEKEGADISAGAIHLIARAADGSVRDGLSLLDQAIAHASGAIDEAGVRAMLGLADRTLTFDLLENVMGGDIAAALDGLARQHAAGAAPGQVLEDVMDLVHWLTRIKVVPATADDPAIPEMERTRGAEMAAKLKIADLTRAWQMLMKGVHEARTAPRAEDAVEMVLIRLAYAANLPSPAQAIEALQKGNTAPASSAASPVSTPAAPTASASPSSAGGGSVEARGATSTPTAPPSQPQPQTQMRTQSPAQATAPVEIVPQPASTPAVDPDAIRHVEDPQADPVTKEIPRTFEDVVQLAADARESLLRASLVNDVHLVKFEVGRIEMRLGEHADRDVVHRLTNFLNEHTGTKWMVAISREAGQPPLRQQWDDKAAREKADAVKHPLVQAVVDAFPDARVEKITKGPGQQAD